MKNSSTKAIICAALCNIIWGFSFLFTRFGLDASPDPNVMLSHRFMIATLFMVILLIFGKGKISFKGKNWVPIALMLILQVVYRFLETYGLLHSNTTLSGLVLAAVPIVTIGTGALFLKEYPTRRQALFCFLPVAGVILMTISGQELGVVKPLGIILLLLTMVTSALYKTVNRKAAQEFTAFERSFLMLANSGLVFTLLGMNSVGWDMEVYISPLLDTKYLISVLILGLLCSVTAQLLNNYAVGRMSAFKMSSFGALSTLCSAFAGVVILQEPMSIMLAMGAILILFGIFQIARPEKSR